MRAFRLRPVLALLALLALASLACQAGTVISEQSAELINGDLIVEKVVTTVEARAAEDPLLRAGGSGTAIRTIDLNLEDTLIDLYHRINPAVVHIFVFNRFESLDIPLGTGSGFVLDLDGHIVTNNHVVADGDTFEVVFADGNRRIANLIGTDVDSDLAVIRVESLPDDVNPIPLADSNDLSVGQFVLAIGNPFGEAGSMSLGIISGLGRTLRSQRVPDGGGRYSLPQVIQTDSAINPGNSGGPLLNLEGQVIGVNSAILSTTGSNTGVGFSIPVNAVRRVAPALIEDGVFQYPFVGVSMSDPLPVAQLEAFDLPPNGAYLTGVVPDTPAEEAGLIGSGVSNFGELLPGGDYIIAVDGNPIKDSSELIGYLFLETEIGQTITLTVLRDGEEIEIPLALGVRP